MQTEYAFTLPRGYVDAAGTVHREGTMRLATARDEIEPLRDVQARQNEAYLAVLLLARVVTRIGDIGEITPELVEELYAAARRWGRSPAPTARSRSRSTSPR